ncbi:hypothetical protein [Acidocella sp.]|uniref:hypothetical protein n=1 Tax=Acidocella sp. TaxID=50710 RepID=UPI00262EB227|nr:hypothetical protein [Acidocella sp.]
MARNKHKTSGLAGFRQGVDGYFTGIVRIDPLQIAPKPARAAMKLITFEPDARTTWHTHSLGQPLIVTSGWV